MRYLFFAGLALVLGLNLSPVSAQPRSTSVSQQTTTNTARPWTYWWWMGNAVTEADITHQLEQFAQAGIGGVHIIPIYGVKGYEK